MADNRPKTDPKISGQTQGLGHQRGISAKITRGKETAQRAVWGMEAPRAEYKIYIVGYGSAGYLKAIWPETFGSVFGQTWPQNPFRTTGLVLQCRLHQKSARLTNSKATSWRETTKCVFSTYLDSEQEAKIYIVPCTWGLGCNRSRLPAKDCQAGGRETLREGRWVSTAYLLEGFQGLRGRPEPENRRFPAGQTSLAVFSTGSQKPKVKPSFAADVRPNLASKPVQIRGARLAVLVAETFQKGRGPLPPHLLAARGRPDPQRSTISGWPGQKPCLPSEE